MYPKNPILIIMAPIVRSRTPTSVKAQPEVAKPAAPASKLEKDSDVQADSSSSCVFRS